MSMLPGNPNHPNANFPYPTIELEKCIDCTHEFLPGSLVQGRCPRCHDVWLDDFIDGIPIGPELRKLAARFGYSIVPHPDSKSDCACAGNDIFIGNYDNSEYLLISFFHEHGHHLVSKKFKKAVNLNTLLIEIEAWNLGIKAAAKLGYFFTDNAIQWAYKKAMSYVGHDEHECSGWEKHVKPGLWKHKCE